MPQSRDMAYDLPFAEPTHYGLGKHGWVTAHLDPKRKPPLELIEAWIDESYRAVAPKKQVYKPTEWNKYRITCNGSRIKVVLNGELIQDANLDEQDAKVKRHDGTDAPPVKDRPRKGHIGFQELSRGSDHVQIRNARIKVLD